MSQVNGEPIGREEFRLMTDTQFAQETRSTEDTRYKKRYGDRQTEVHDLSIDTQVRGRNVILFIMNRESER